MQDVQAVHKNIWFPCVLSTILLVKQRILNWSFNLNFKPNHILADCMQQTNLFPKQINKLVCCIQGTDIATFLLANQTPPLKHVISLFWFSGILAVIYWEHWNDIVWNSLDFSFVWGCQLKWRLKYVLSLSKWKYRKGMFCSWERNKVLNLRTFNSMSNLSSLLS